MRVLFIFLFAFPTLAQGQSYFPPLTGDDWDTMDFAELGYCSERIDTLYDFLEEKGTKSFIILKDGKIVLERYFGTYSQDSLWYWASSAKSLAAYLVGCAQEDGFLDIEDPTSDYLGQGWTSAPAEKEELITVRNQITMTTGLDHWVLDQDCIDPTCLDYMADAGDQWFYYNAPYRLVQDVVANATGTGINLYTWDRIGSRIGMGGLWVNYLRFSKARDMARFGLLSLNNGVWDTDIILADEEYKQAMISQSQEFNEAYGYLWWLNGSNTVMLPGTMIVWPTTLIPSAPIDLYAALGKNDQKIYVIPSENMVVIRQGNSAGQSLAGPSSFDEDLWVKINELVCEPDGLTEIEQDAFSIYPNPTQNRLNIRSRNTIYQLDIHSVLGRKVLSVLGPSIQSEVDISALKKGLYKLSVRTSKGEYHRTFIKD